MGAAVVGTFGRSMALKGSGQEPHHTVTPRRGPDEGSVRIAVVQQDGNPGQVETNRNKALAFAREALDQKADVILFHEEIPSVFVKMVFPNKPGQAIHFYFCLMPTPGCHKQI